MKTQANLDGIYAPSEDIVSRDVGGEFIIIPITSGIGDLDNEVFTLNNTGRAIWGKLDGKSSLNDIISSLSLEFEDRDKKIKNDVFGLVKELLERRILVEVRKK